MEAHPGDGVGRVRGSRVRAADRRPTPRLWQYTHPPYSPNRSAADQISGETVAIKLVTRVFEKVQLAKRALREITLLRHFANHENITGLIDMDVISPDFQEMYVYFSSVCVRTN